MRKDVREFIRRLEAAGLTVEPTPGHYRVLRKGKPLRRANGMPFMLPFPPTRAAGAEQRSSNFASSASTRRRRSETPKPADLSATGPRPRHALTHTRTCQVRPLQLKARAREGRGSTGLATRPHSDCADRPASRPESSATGRRGWRLPSDMSSLRRAPAADRLLGRAARRIAPAPLLSCGAGGRRGRRGARARGSPHVSGRCRRRPSVGRAPGR